MKSALATLVLLAPHGMAALAAEPAAPVRPLGPLPAAVARLPLTQVAPRFVRKTLRPEADRPSARMARELEEANAIAASRLSALKGALPAPAPSLDAGLAGAMPCHQRIAAVDNQPGGGFRLQPGQNLLVTGCFGAAAATSVVVRHEGSGQVWNAQVIQAGPQFVYAHLADVTGVADGPVQLSVAFANATVSNTVRGTFVARRQTYEVHSTGYTFAARIASGVPEVCSFQSCYWDSPGQSPNRVYVQRNAPTLSEHRFSALKPGYQVVGYLVSLLRGTVADGGWGADGSVVVRFGTEAVGNDHVSDLLFDRLFVEGPAGLPPR